MLRSKFMTRGIAPHGRMVLLLSLRYLSGMSCNCHVFCFLFLREKEKRKKERNFLSKYSNVLQPLTKFGPITTGTGHVITLIPIPLSLGPLLVNESKFVLHFGIHYLFYCLLKRYSSVKTCANKKDFSFVIHFEKNKPDDY